MAFLPCLTGGNRAISPDFAIEFALDTVLNLVKHGNMLAIDGIDTQEWLP